MPCRIRSNKRKSDMSTPGNEENTPDYYERQSNLAQKIPEESSTPSSVNKNAASKEAIAREAAIEIGERIPYWTPQKEDRIAAIIQSAIDKAMAELRHQLS